MELLIPLDIENKTINKTALHILLDDEADVYRIHPRNYIDIEDQNKMTDVDLAMFLLKKRHLDESYQAPFRHMYYIDTSSGMSNSKEFVFTNNTDFYAGFTFMSKLLSNRGYVD
jgi:hypothetical protein